MEKCLLTKNQAKLQAINWPLAYSKKQASELLGWPVAFITQCQKAGCPAFKHSRVYTGELVQWVGNKGEESDIDWSRALKKEQALHEKVKREKTEGRMVDIVEVRADAASIQGVIFSELDRIYLNEFPAMAKGLDELGIRSLSKKFLEMFRESIKAKMEAMGKKE